MVRRILKADVETVHHFSSEYWTDFSGSVADRDDIIKLSPDELVNRFWMLSGDINANLGHDLDSQWVNFASRMGSGGIDLPLRMFVLKKTLRHLASAGVTSTENQYFHD